MDAPVQYVEVDGTDVAWRTYAGAGDRDVVLMFGGTLPIAALSDDPVVVRLIEGMQALGRVIVFDRRGVGQSGPIGDWGVNRFELQRRDLEAVLDAAGSDHPVVVGHGNACPAILAEAVRRGPGSMTVVLCEPINPWTQSSEFRARFAEVVAKILAAGREVMELLTPDRLAEDPGFLAWHVRAGNLGAGPAAAGRLVAPPTDDEVEALAALVEEVDVPMLVLRRPECFDEDVQKAFGLPLWPKFQLFDLETIRHEDERFGATHRVELPGRDWMMLVGARINDVIAEISEFVTGSTCATLTDRMLRAVLFTDLGGSTELLSQIGDDRWRSLIDRHDQGVHRAVARHGGQVVKTTGDGVLATFGSATGALIAATEVRDLLRAEGLEVRTGVHVGDIEPRGDDIAGIAVNIAARVLGHAEPGQIIATATAAAAASGSSLRFDPAGTYDLRGVPGPWELLRLAADPPTVPGLPPT